MSDARDEVEEMLRDVPSRTRGVMDKNPELVAAIAHFLDLKRDGDERVAHVTLAWFYATKLRERYSGPKTMDTVRAYVRETMRRDPSTGAAL